MARDQLDDKERRDWLRLMKSEHVGPATFRHLLARYGDAATALAALPELSKRGGLSRPVRIYPAEAAEAELERAADLGARFIALGEAGLSTLAAPDRCSTSPHLRPRR